MIKKIFLKSEFLVAFFAIILSGCDDKSIPAFLNSGAALAVSVNFEDGRLLGLNTNNGDDAKICKPHVDQGSGKETAGNTYQMDIAPCKVEPDSNNNPELKAALELSKKQINGEIVKDGKKVPARFLVTVIGLYEGSNCQTASSGGDQYVNCVNPPPLPKKKK